MSFNVRTSVEVKGSSSCAVLLIDTISGPSDVLLDVHLDFSFLFQCFQVMMKKACWMSFQGE